MPFTLLAVICVAMTASAQQPFVLKLYPDGVQESNGLNVDTPDNPREPILTVYLPKGRTTGQTVVVCPGGEAPQIRLQIIQAVSALTGLGSDCIAVSRGNLS